MPLPFSPNIETPVLQELSAVGGTDDVRFLYERLISYFPSLSDAEISAIKSGENRYWKKAVQKAGKTLDENKLIRRERGIWSLTDQGRRSVEAETKGIIFSKIEIENESLSHRQVQEMLVKIGEILGFYAETEFQYYDVVWRETPKNQRLSHVFEVQSKGNLDSAFAKLKRAHDAQRSKIFLILASERDTNRANKSLAQEFRELENILTILSFVELRKMHENLSSIAHLLPNFLRA
ncbi:MAG TPA: winged helix-turn-helix domain-containing protein [Pyrinomonadaceae bacterium]|nr:winged helix-turn-helix domain-containing protein [Pyrinomonadaceae bacterium]